MSARRRSRRPYRNGEELARVLQSDQTVPSSLARLGDSTQDDLGGHSPREMKLVGSLIASGTRGCSRQALGTTLSLLCQRVHRREPNPSR